MPRSRLPRPARSPSTLLLVGGYLGAALTCLAVVPDRGGRVAAVVAVVYLLLRLALRRVAASVVAVPRRRVPAVGPPDARAAADGGTARQGALPSPRPLPVEPAHRSTVPGRTGVQL